ncbi:50S ribosomal protein L18 [Candidatus Parcubacteria bacterium]|jgi:large subunit ribosomal protein L18|nr:50S ribosomal protein L18 [Candidatus Parcubacteria bacterium]MBT3949232.1 50S ribosomal protein L18 [Candidatus Parcubacteria bacterium]
MKKLTKEQQRKRRRVRSRARMNGTADCPRLSVHRSLGSMSAQIINDVDGKTIVSVNSKKDVDAKADAGERKGKTAVGFLLGKKIAEKAKEANVTKIVFDRSGYAYQGRVQALADGAREGGLQF